MKLLKIFGSDNLIKSFIQTEVIHKAFSYIFPEKRTITIRFDEKFLDSF